MFTSRAFHSVGFFVLICLGLAPQMAGGADVRCAAELLSKEAIQALVNAPGGLFGYGVSVLTHPDGRTVVLLGEGHYKTRFASESGANIVGAFDEIGFEGTRETPYWGAPLMKVLNSFQHIAFTVFSLGLLRYPSTVSVAHSAPGKNLTRLERGHRPDLSEEVFFVAFPLAVFGGFASALVSAVAHATGFSPELPAGLQPSLNQALDYLAFALNLGAIQGFAMRYLDPTHSVGIIHNRNRTMVKNLLEALAAARAEGEQRPVLAIVGRLHMKGMKSLLIGEGGFAEVPLEAPQESP